MEEFFRMLVQTDAASAVAFSFPNVITTLVLSFLLALVLAYTYRVTHRGVSYSVTSVHSMVISGVTTALLMTIIGSNIARAFSLIGALSIVRFRNAVKETRDVG